MFILLNNLIRNQLIFISKLDSKYVSYISVSGKSVFKLYRQK